MQTGQPVKIEEYDYTEKFSIILNEITEITQEQKEYKKQLDKCRLKKGSLEKELTNLTKEQIKLKSQKDFKAIGTSQISGGEIQDFNEKIEDINKKITENTSVDISLTDDFNNAQLSILEKITSSQTQQSIRYLLPEIETMPSSYEEMVQIYRKIKEKGLINKNIADETDVLIPSVEPKDKKQTEENKSVITQQLNTLRSRAVKALQQLQAQPPYDGLVLLYGKHNPYFIEQNNIIFAKFDASIQFVSKLKTNLHDDKDWLDTDKQILLGKIKHIEENIFQPIEQRKQQWVQFLIDNKTLIDEYKKFKHQNDETTSNSIFDHEISSLEKIRDYTKEAIAEMEEGDKKPEFYLPLSVAQKSYAKYAADQSGQSAAFGRALVKERDFKKYLERMSWESRWNSEEGNGYFDSYYADRYYSGLGSRQAMWGRSINWMHYCGLSDKFTYLGKDPVSVDLILQILDNIHGHSSELFTKSFKKACVLAVLTTLVPHVNSLKEMSKFISLVQDSQLKLYKEMQVYDSVIELIQKRIDKLQPTWQDSLKFLAKRTGKEERVAFFTRIIDLINDKSTIKHLQEINDVLIKANITHMGASKSKYQIKIFNPSGSSIADNKETSHGGFLLNEICNHLILEKQTTDGVSDVHKNQVQELFRELKKLYPTLPNLEGYSPKIEPKPRSWFG